MPHKIVKITTDPLQRLEQLWPRLHAWQRTLILTRAVFFALPAIARGGVSPPAYHWLNTPAHWI